MFNVTYSCEDDIADAKEVRSVLDSIIKVRENRMNEFSGAVTRILSNSLENNFNRGNTAEIVKRSHYDLIKGASAIEVNRLISQFVPVLEELNRNEDVRKRLLDQNWNVYLKNKQTFHIRSVHMFIIWQVLQQASPQQASPQRV